MPRRADKPTKPNHPSPNGIEGMLSGLSSLLGTLSELAEKGEQLKKSGAFQTKDGKDVSFHYGVSVRTAEGGRQVRVEPFGNMKTGDAAKESPVKEVREPLTDVFEEDDHVLVVVEMPGISKADASFEIDGDVLTIAAQGDKRYRKELLLPADGLRLTKDAIRCNNGVFELRLTR
jgi:HSP20 family protein